MVHTPETALPGRYPILTFCCMPPVKSASLIPTLEKIGMSRERYIALKMDGVGRLRSRGSPDLLRVAGLVLQGLVALHVPGRHPPEDGPHEAGLYAGQASPFERIMDEVFPPRPVG